MLRHIVLPYHTRLDALNAVARESPKLHDMFCHGDVVYGCIRMQEYTVSLHLCNVAGY